MSYGENFYAPPFFNTILPAGKSTRPDPRKNYVATGPTLWPRMLSGLEHGFDEVSRSFGARTYKAMLTDPAVSSSYNSLRLSVVDCRVDLAPRVKAPISYRPGDQSSEGLTPEQKMSQDVLAFCKRNQTRIAELLPAVRMDLLSCMGFGCKLSEFSFKAAEFGDDKGKLVWSGVRVKPNWAWRFIVDNTLQVQRILTWNSTTGLYEALDVTTPEGAAKFHWISWMAEDGDPRGTSILRPAYNAWNLKIQTWPLYYQHTQRFASPGLKGKLAPNDTNPKPAIDDDGLPIDGQLMSATEHFAQLLRIYRGGGVIVFPDGAEVDVVEPTSAGQAFIDAFDLFDRQITRGIELQVRASMESKFGSKADSGTAQDTKGLVTGYGRTMESGFWQGAYKALVRLNFGEEIAEDHTPIVSPGKAEQQDKSRIWGGLASLVATGYVGESQKPEIDAEVGLPPRDAKADAEAKAEDEARKAKLDSPPADPKPSPNTPKNKGVTQ